jgi:hypothetical protein
MQIGTKKSELIAHNVETHKAHPHTTAAGNWNASVWTRTSRQDVEDATHVAFPLDVPVVQHWLVGHLCTAFSYAEKMHATESSPTFCDLCWNLTKLTTIKTNKQTRTH